MNVAAMVISVLWQQRENASAERLRTERQRLLAVLESRSKPRWRVESVFCQACQIHIPAPLWQRHLTGHRHSL